MRGISLCIIVIPETIFAIEQTISATQEAIPANGITISAKMNVN